MTEEKESCGLRIFERRKHFRFPWNLPIEYSKDNSNVIYPGYTLNASKSGLLALVSEKLKIGQQLAMTIFFSYGPEVKAADLFAEVVWVNDIQGSGDYQTGLRFVDFNPKEIRS